MDGPFYDDAVALLRSSLTDAEGLLQMVDDEPRTHKKRPGADADAEELLEMVDQEACAPKKRPAAAPQPSLKGPGTPSGPETGSSMSFSSSTSNSSTQSCSASNSKRRANREASASAASLGGQTNPATPPGKDD